MPKRNLKIHSKDKVKQWADTLPSFFGQGQSPEKMALRRAVNMVGGQSALARLLGVKQQHVYYWLKKSVPARRVLAIERATEGQVTRHELRPDLYPIDKGDKKEMP